MKTLKSVKLLITAQNDKIVLMAVAEAMI